MRRRTSRTRPRGSRSKLRTSFRTGVAGWLASTGRADIHDVWRCLRRRSSRSATRSGPPSSLCLPWRRQRRRARQQQPARRQQQHRARELQPEAGSCPRLRVLVAQRLRQPGRGARGGQIDDERDRQRREGERHERQRRRPRPAQRSQRHRGCDHREHQQGVAVVLPARHAARDDVQRPDGDLENGRTVTSKTGVNSAITSGATATSASVAAIPPRNHEFALIPQGPLL